MKNIFQIFVLCGFLFLQINAEAQTTSSNREKNEKKILELVLKTLNEEHVNPKKIDDVFSRAMFKNYIDTLDIDRLFFLQSDIDEFKKYETKLDDQIKNNDLSFPDLTRKIYLQRMSESKELYLKILKGNLDFKADDYWDAGNKIPFAKNKFELEVRWIKFLKKTAIEYTRGNNEPNSTFTDFENITNNFCKVKFLNVLERSNLNVDSVNNEVIFTIYLNSLIQHFDSHSKYLNNREYNRYYQEKNGVYAGFGFTFNLKDDFATVSEIDLGGPAWQTKKISVGDVILKRAYDDEQPISFVGKSIFEASKIIQKKAPLVIHYTLKKPDGSIYEVSLKRGTIVSNDFFVKSVIVSKNNHKYALLSVPLFYKNLRNEANEIKNTSDDFKNELKNLQNENIEGIVLDLRNNNGGDLEQANNIVSNFVQNNNVFQYKELNTKPVIVQSINSEIVFDKNIVVLVNAKTASTAELIADILKNKNIAIIAGQNTFGNSTIQSSIELDKLKPISDNENYYGNLFITKQRIYNLLGKPLPKTGVQVDVILENEDLITRESNLVSNAEENFITPAESKAINNLDYFKEIVKKSKTRLEKNKLYKNIINDKFRTERNAIKTLNLYKYKKLYDTIFIKYGNKPLTNYNNNLNFISNLEYEKLMKKKQYLIQKRNLWLESLKTDFQIEEGINILEDMLYMKQ